MNYKLTTESGKEINFNDEQLIDFLMTKVLEFDEDEDLKSPDSLTAEIFKKLPSEALAKANLNQLFSINFLFGYYYSRFILKNTVEITQED